MKRIIVVSAHPDDMELGMGGTVAALAAAGAEVTSVVLTDGGGAPNPFSWPRERMAAVRKEETKAAAEVLGVGRVIFFDLPDLRSDANYRAAGERLAGVLTEVAPAEVYTLHDAIDRHPSHRLAGRVTTESLAQAGVAPTPALWAYEAWGPFSSWDRLEYIDEQMGVKLMAISMHKSQLASVPYSEGVAGLNRWRAIFADPHQTENHGAFAEAFVKLEAPRG